jgi:HEPN domain-containing protein
MNREAKQWMIKSDNDFKTVNILINQKERDIVPDSVCFHSQQCIEKLLKGFLVYHHIKFKRVHDLFYLVKLCESVDVQFKELYTLIDELAYFAVNVRYPDSAYALDIKDAISAFNAMEKGRQFILSKLTCGEFK